MKLRYALISAILALASSIAVAGFIQPQVVFIDEANRFAQGDMWTARTADNNVEFIGCGIRKFDDFAGGAIETGFCQATDADGVLIVCTTINEELMDGMPSGEYGFVTFSWNELFECTRIGSSNQSFYLPNFKIQKGMGGGDDED